MSDRLLRFGTAAAVLLVAVIAAVISYQHLYALAYTHGEPRLDAALIPLSIDGTVITASLLMLRAARAGLPTPWLARLMLVGSVVMTVAANVAFGWSFAWWGILMAGFPAAAFLGNAEAAIMYGRKTARVAGQVSPGLPAALAHPVPARVPLPTHRQVREEYQCGPTTAKKIRAGMVAAVKAASNGHPDK